MEGPEQQRVEGAGGGHLVAFCVFMVWTQCFLVNIGHPFVVVYGRGGLSGKKGGAIKRDMDGVGWCCNNGGRTGVKRAGGAGTIRMVDEQAWHGKGGARVTRMIDRQARRCSKGGGDGTIEMEKGEGNGCFRLSFRRSLRGGMLVLKKW